MFALGLAAAVLWLAVLLLPWRPWSTRERLAPKADTGEADEAVTVLIPARNEAGSIVKTLEAVAEQPSVASVVVVDDRSDDGTAELAAAVRGVRVIAGQPSPAGWSGKLWAQQQGLAAVGTPLVLLLDADIELAPGMVPALVDKLERGRLDQVSVMAALPAGTLPEKLMLPAFVFFFKQLYPFAWVNRTDRPFAAAAGGCVLVRREMLKRIGAFSAWRDALIDDCELARRVRRAGGSIWLGLSHGVRSLRRHPDLGSILETIRRTAYVQLGRSPVLALVVAIMMVLAFAVPPTAVVAGAMAGGGPVVVAGATAWLLMALAYAPQVRFCGLAVGWMFTLPLSAMLFLYATLDSAVRHHFGRGAGWKGRHYAD
ncbi:MAG: glycosyltransferase [Candidatus Wenzhouxiangella sp. M2_3B_020]